MQNGRCRAGFPISLAATSMLWPCSAAFAGDPPLSEAPVETDESVTTGEDEGPLEINVTATRPLARPELMHALQKLVERRSMVVPAYRFEQPLCLTVTGFDPGEAQVFAKRVLANTTDTGLRIASAKCQPNAFVMAVDDPEKLFNKLARRRRDLIGPVRFRDVTEDKLKAELREGRPAVAWNRLMMHNPDGGLIDDLGIIEARRGEGAWRLASPTRLVKQFSIIIFDANQIDGIPLSKLADYASMHLLGTPRRKIDFEGDIDLARIPTVLSLFNAKPEEAPDQLTIFDRSYLRGVYSAKPNVFNNQLNFAVTKANRALQGENYRKSAEMDNASAP